ncbi:MAG: hypothetical protein H8F28_11720, partial [Fibrella sp.]|nr:hypothetical protein [Armatimonadota bacterium]
LTGKEEIVGSNVREEPKVPLIAPVLTLIVSTYPFFIAVASSQHFQRDWFQMCFYLLLGITLLLISIKLFEQWYKRRKENAGLSSPGE